MNALPSQHAVALRELAAPAWMPGSRVRADRQGRLWAYVGLLTAFWVDVALSNVLYAGSMQAGLSAINAGHIYAPWNVRLMQHAILYPVWLGSMWVALRVGWQPFYRALPVQLLLGLSFSALASPVLWVCEHWMEPRAAAAMHETGAGWADLYDGYMWLAAATSFLLTYGFGLALITAFAFYRRLRDSEVRSAGLERALERSQLAALRMQLSPHTLFNLLHTIRGHIAWDPAAAQTMVVQLGDLLRRLLTAGERDFSRLRDEIQLVRLYLELQQKRFSDRLSMLLPEAESLPRAWVPSLILQPLIENAVVHGLAGHDGEVAIRVEVLAREETLMLRVTNTVGPGARIGGAGIGVGNVRERLAIQFGDRAHLTTTCGLDRLWMAEIRMPLLRDGPAGVGALHRSGAQGR